jgi:hypothetical protein
MSEEEKKAIEYLKNRLEILHNNTQWATENNIKVVLNLIEKQQKEIEEKTTILLAGAEKVKQLEKGNRSLMESRIKWKNRYYKEKAKNKECISKDKIRKKINYYRKYCGYDGVTMIGNTQLKELEELLEEN